MTTQTNIHARLARELIAVYIDAALPKDRSTVGRVMLRRALDHLDAIVEIDEEQAQHTQPSFIEVLPSYGKDDET